MKTPLVVGNWKMHGSCAEARTLTGCIRQGTGALRTVEVALAPPFTALSTVATILKRGNLRLAAQNVHWEEAGAFTGEISPKMLRDLGCRYVIVGHSERRHLFHEDNRTIAKKIAALLRTELGPILCVGETLKERDKGTTVRVISRQVLSALKGLPKNGIGKITFAYEPVWAIGTGRNANPDQITHVHSRIREILKGLLGKAKATNCRILYGGSVRPENAGELARTPEVDGLLVGGASLRAEGFLKIIREFSRSWRGQSLEE